MIWILAVVAALLLVWMVAWLIGRRYPSPYKDIPEQELRRYENGAQL